MVEALRVGVIGAGSWGTTVAHLAARNRPTTLWARRAEVADEIERDHTNEAYLPGRRLAAGLRASCDVADVVRDADLLALAVPTSGFRDVVEEVARHVRPGVPIISLSKGFEAVTLARMSEVIADVLPAHPVGVLTGPNLAKEIMDGQAAAAVIGTQDDALARSIQDVLANGLFRVYVNDDVIGCEVAGALKNVIAVATGIAEGLGVGDNTRAMVVTRGLAELTRLGVAMGGRPETFAGLAGMGDLVATCMSPQSRNRTVGERLGRGERLTDIMADTTQVAEGVRTAEVVMELGRRHGVDLPICAEIHAIVHDGAPAVQAYRGLVSRPAGREAEPG